MHATDIKKLQATSLMIFRFMCLLLFLYQAWIISESYLQMEKFSQTRFVRKEEYPVPLICVTTKDFAYDGFNNSLNITHDDYVDGGKWHFEGYSVKEIWDFLTPDLDDLMSGVKLENNTTKYSDKYEKLKISVSKLKNFGINIIGRIFTIIAINIIDKPVSKV